MKYRSWLQKIIYFGLPLGIFVLLVTVRNIWVFAKLGSLAMYLLTVSLMIKPIMVIFRWRWAAMLVGLRREIGIAIVWLFVGHFLGLYLSGRYDVPGALNPNNFIVFGVMAGVGLVMLGLTSNDWAVRKLGRNWKKLHRLAYPIYFLVLYHGNRAEGEVERFYVVGGVFVFLKVWQYLKAKRI